MKAKDIFGLAVRLLGLFFIYLGLKAATPLLDSDTVEMFNSSDKSDIINAVLPVVFNLAVAWWLLGGGLLVRRAYPETPKISERMPSHDKPAAPSTESAETVLPSGLTDMDKAEKKLAALVEKPKETHTP